MKFLKFWFPVILYSGIIFYVSSIPELKTAAPVPFFDKLLHVFEYAVLGFLLARALKNENFNWLTKQKIIWITLLFCLTYGASDEFHQLFVEGREASLLDVLADSVGGFLGGIIYRK